MLDMDGTVYKGIVAIPGAKEFVGRLKERKIPFVFLTNNSSSGRVHYLNKLLNMGFDVSIDNILTSTTASISFLKKHRSGKKVYPVGTPKFIEELTEAGIPLVERRPDIVLLSFDTTITYEKINNAYNFLKDGSEFIATHPDDLCPTADGYDIDIGPFIRMFESAASVKAKVIGKPNAEMARMAAETMNVPFERMVMIGDRVYTDMRMAADAGIRSVMVLSGEAKRGDPERAGIRPTVTIDSVADLLK